MRWFKHLTMAHSNEELSAVLEELGAEAYGVWWLILEDVASAMEPKSTVASCTHSIVKWSQICYCSARKFRSIACRLTEKRLIVTRSTGDRLQIDIPKLFKYRDEYSQRSGQTHALSRSDTDQIQSREENPPTPLAEKPVTDSEAEEFAAWAEAAYNRHPKKANHSLAMLALKKFFATDKPAREVFDRNHELWIKTETWREKNGTYVPPLCKPDGSGFIEDLAWRSPPPADKRKGNPLERYYRELEEPDDHEETSRGPSATVRELPKLPEGSGGPPKQPPAKQALRGSSQGIPGISAHERARRGNHGLTAARSDLLALAGADLRSGRVGHESDVPRVASGGAPVLPVLRNRIH